LRQTTLTTPRKLASRVECRTLLQIAVPIPTRDGDRLSHPCIDRSAARRRLPSEVDVAWHLIRVSSICVVHSSLAKMPLWAGMRTKMNWSPDPGVKVLGVALTDDPIHSLPAEEALAKI